MEKYYKGYSAIVDVVGGNGLRRHFVHFCDMRNSSRAEEQRQSIKVSWRVDRSVPLNSESRIHYKSDQIYRTKKKVKRNEEYERWGRAGMKGGNCLRGNGVLLSRWYHVIVKNKNEITRYEMSDHRFSFFFFFLSFSTILSSACLQLRLIVVEYLVYVFVRTILFPRTTRYYFHFAPTFATKREKYIETGLKMWNKITEAHRCGNLSDKNRFDSSVCPVSPV